jgi:site-specific DNA-cytosine methylase
MTQRKVVDLFACIGGFSTGASQSGHNIVLAVDCDETALAVHEANHPRTTHKLMFLGPDTEAELVALIRSLIPDDGTEWHLHGSPPCTKLSNARSMSRKRDPSILKMGQKEGLDLVEWYLDFVAKMNPTSWSMEQVDCKMVRDALEVRKRSNIRFLDYNVTNFVNYGVPQTRTRMIAGSPFLIHRLRFGNGMFEPVAKTIQDAIPNLPPEACYQRSNEHRKSDPSSTEEGADGTFLNEDAESRCRPLHQPSFTIMSHPMQWWDAAYRCVRNLNLCEVLALQTFPVGYKFPPGVLSVDQHKGVGNAVPPEFARRFMSVL